MKVTVQDLTDAEACRAHVDLFRDTFGDSVEVTEETLDLAVTADLDLAWAFNALPDVFRSFRAWACQSPYYAYLYALDVDRAPRQDTRAAACQDPEWAYLYARYVDRAPRDDTRAAACQAPRWAYSYAYCVDKAPHPDTRAAACPDPAWAYYYALDVDRAPRDDTRAAVEGTRSQARYESAFPEVV